MAHGCGLAKLPSPHPSPFTRILEGPGNRRQCSRLFRTLQGTSKTHSGSQPTAGPPPLTNTRRPPTTSFTRHNPTEASHQRRQRSKRFRPRPFRGHAAQPYAELSPAPQLLSVESPAPTADTHNTPSEASISNRAEPLLLPVGFAVPIATIPAPPPAYTYLPHASEFPPAFHRPPRPNTAPCSNSVHHNPALDTPRVSTQLNRSAWAFYLCDYPDPTFVKTLLHIIDYGTNISFSGDRTAPQSSQNLRLAMEHSEVVTTDLQLQLGKHRVYGPFPALPFINFRSSPLGVAAHKRSSKLRVIHRLSWPDGTSVNDGVDNSEASIIYETFRSAVEALRTSGRGSSMIKLDLEQAFRQIPVRPADWPLLGFNWLGDFYYHVVLTFGLCSAPYIFNLFSEALHWILDHHLPAFIRHLLDDFLQIFSPSTSSSSLHHALEWTLSLGSALGLRFQLSKVEGPTTSLEFLGITLDSLAMEARLPPDKLAYLLELLRSWDTRTHCCLRELQELMGYLQFCSQVIPYSRAFIRSLFNFTASFTTPHARRRIPKPVHRDISWWLNLAGTWNGISIIEPDRPEITVHMDASGTKGAGSVLQDQWFAIRVPRRYTHHDIQFKEFYAIIYSILCWGDYFRGNHILFHTDNTDVHAALSNLTIRSGPMMELLRQFLGLACCFNFTFESRWISGSTNSLADAASRFQYQRLFDLAPYLQHKPSPKLYRIDNSLPSGARPTIVLH